MKPLFPLAASAALALLLPLTLSAQETPQEEKPEKQAEPKLKSNIRISKETTYLSEPVTKEGYINYLQALNTRMSEGVTPENNAAVLLIKAFGPRVTPQVAGDRAYKMLGIDPLPAKGQYYQPLKDVVYPGEGRVLTPEESQTLNKLYDKQYEAMKSPWSSQTYPELAQWLKVNEEPLKLVTEAANRPKLNFPLIAGVDDEEKPGMVIAVLLPWAQETRELARILSCRAMWYLEQGNTEAARQDLLTTHKLARLTSTGFSLIEKLVGYAIEATARQADLAVLEHGKLSEQELLEFRKQLKQLPPMDPIVNSVDKGERLMGLDAISMLDREGLSEINNLLGGAAEDSALVKVVDFLARNGGVDWNEVMIRMNKSYDDLVAAFNQPTYDQQIEAFEKQEEQVKALKMETSDPLKLSAQLLVSGNPRMFISRQVGNVLIALLLPAISSVHEAETRTKTNIDLFDLALVLTVHKQRTGSYPEKLDALVPAGLIAKVPVDVYSGKPYVYQKTDTGYFIYSFGRNREDDKGLSFDDETRGDDLIIRMPAVHKPRQ